MEKLCFIAYLWTTKQLFLMSTNSNSNNSKSTNNDNDITWEMNLKHKYNLVDNKYVNMLCSSSFNEWGHHNGHLNDSTGMLIEVGLKQWYIIYIFSLKMDLQLLCLNVHDRNNEDKIIVESRWHNCTQLQHILCKWLWLFMGFYFYLLK